MDVQRLWAQGKGSRIGGGSSLLSQGVCVRMMIPRWSMWFNVVEKDLRLGRTGSPQEVHRKSTGSTRPEPWATELVDDYWLWNHCGPDPRRCYFVSYVKWLKRYMQYVCTSQCHPLYPSTASFGLLCYRKKLFSFSLSLSYTVILYCIFATIDSLVPHPKHIYQTYVQV
jgi:hypothetical protein